MLLSTHLMTFPFCFTRSQSGVASLRHIIESFPIIIMEAAFVSAFLGFAFFMQQFRQPGGKWVFNVSFSVMYKRLLIQDQYCRYIAVAATGALILIFLH